MPAPTPPPKKLNPLALPPYTAVFFALIALVILGAAFASFLPYSQIGWPLIVLPLTLLPLRDFLHGPDREKSSRHFRLSTPAEAPLQQAVNELSQQAGIHPPQVLINEDGSSLYAFGTFRRHFISVGANMAEILAEELQDEDLQTQQTARALLAHEIAHFANGDMQRAALARSMLKMPLLTALVSIWAAIGFVSVLVQIGPEITSPGFWDAAAATTGIPGLSLAWMPETMRAQNPHLFDLLANPTKAGDYWRFAILYLANIFIPFLMSVPILYLFFWRKLMRVREYYADLRAASWLRDSQYVIQAMTLHRALTNVRPQPKSQGPLRPQRLLAFSWSASAGMLAYHPSPEDRKKALRSPLHLFGSPWRLAFWTGVAVLLLEIILRSSLTLIYVAQPAPYLPLLTATAVFGVWLLPRILAGESFRSLLKTSFQMALFFMLVKLSINFLDALFLGLAAGTGRLGDLGHLVDVYLRSMLGGAGAESGPIFGGEFGWAQFLDWQIIRPIAYYLFFGIPLLTGVLAALIKLMQRALTWYRVERKLMTVFWSVLLVLIGVQILLAYPLANILFFPMIYEWTWETTLRLALGLLLALIGTLWFRQKHGQHAHRCPKCGEFIPDDFKLGQTCLHCHYPLHSWLIATYL